MSKLGPSKPCPCGSGATYGECCRPAHEGQRAPATAEALMRSRYSAFALGEVDYLIDTLAAAHPDRDEDPTALRIALREVCRTGRFMGLTVFEAHERGDRATVRFRARVFSGGVDRSFEETSDFVRERNGWRYLGARELE